MLAEKISAFRGSNWALSCVCVCVCVAALTRVAVSEQGADGQQDLGDGEGRTPVVLQDVQTDHPLTVDVTVVDPGAERHLDDAHKTRGSNH